MEQHLLGEVIPLNGSQLPQDTCGDWGSFVTSQQTNRVHEFQANQKEPMKVTSPTTDEKTKQRIVCIPFP
ncbi:hypothetical protein L195_g016982 [Trifolium pratense]|uniref:Uncharacterized protein n=1 Tax=Trifolium pratense TaxID=57577 RepID=A0A2K3MSM4_TRIPR|nr:hypothetical protein L195_g016982 [Trifolium pratense]